MDERNKERLFEDMASVLKALANPIRLKILALCSAREMSSKELRETLNISKPLLIAHLRVLLRKGLLTYKIEVDEDKGIVRKFYRTSNFNICVSREKLSSLNNFI